ncbi:MAG: NAD-dependent epimerase/dehydratase family protein [Sulfuricurvum sp.]|jgi:GDP-L-fucose synthase|uniref:NAD-dependent epimerase/dehydratase family protein n=1 Tax=Sulfuricurvum sp. TaxID=2025608 RepID=UPI0025CE6F62|nr:NAD-dependent epimerase/dehydratase family protein [Sulfuricurvum sp.]MCK9373416.1 NAD-dependent epimerase/dehydratase family protein [Sulfuricurvum sp.]
MKMKILIIGANGFIGRHLQKHLANNSLYTLLTPESKTLDISDEVAVDAYIEETKPDLIINCANRGGGRDSTNENIVHENLRMFFNIVKHSDKVSKIIHFGSGAEYGKHKPIQDAKEEDANSAMPLDEYGFYKSVCSKCIEQSDNNLNLRIFGCYGEYENYRFKFISNAIVKNLLHLPITIHKNVFFDYIYVEDLVKIVEYFLHHETAHKVYNVTTGRKIDLLSLARLINETGDFTSEIKIINEGLNNEYTSDNSRLMDEIEDFEFTSHREAIIRMRNYFRSILHHIDREKIEADPYLQLCTTFWKQSEEKE